MEIIRECIEETNNLLNHRFYYLESHYQTVLVGLLRAKFGSIFSVSTEVALPYKLDNGIVFGYGKIDIILENETNIFILELKANHFKKNHKSFLGQLRRYLYHCSNPKNKTKIGILVVFGEPATVTLV